MRYYQRLALKRSVISGIASIALLVFAYSATLGKDLQGYLESAQSYSEKGNLKAAEIELRNAVRQAPQDAQIHARLAQVYLKLGEFASAEREARLARDLKGDEADYLLTLAESLMRQGKFADIPVQVKPGARTPELESKVRVILATAAAALGDGTKAEAILRDAVSIEPQSLGP